MNVSHAGIARVLWHTIRPKTLSAAVVPVVVATALVSALGFSIEIWISVCALLSAVFIQIGTNLVNDALDFEKGADTDSRLGEARATHQGWLTKRQVMFLAMSSFSLSFVLGVPLVIEGGWPIVWIGLASLLMGYAYTGGPFPLAYIGLGDLFVLLFFGFAAVGGVFFLHAKILNWPVVVAGSQVGLLATVLIAINNLRDLDQDRLVGKNTLAVRLGPRWGRIEVLLLVTASFLLNIFWLTEGFHLAFWLPMMALPLALRVLWKVLTTPADRSYNQLLSQAAMVHMLFGVLLSIGFVFP